MPACGNCSQSCNCVLSEDGFFSGHTEEGRPFTQVEGSGTTEDPYVIHFIDQELFRPKAAEIQWQDGSCPDSTGGFGDLDFIADITPGSSIIYESPIKFLIDDLNNGDPRYANSHYFIIGASVTFAETGDAQSNPKMLLIVSGKPTTGLRVIGGQTIPGAGADPMTLSAQGYTIGRVNPIAGVGAFINQFDLWLYQDTGAAVAISNIKVWMTQI